MAEPEEINVLLPLMLVVLLGTMAAIIGILYWLAKRLHVIYTRDQPVTAEIVKAATIALFGVLLVSVLLKSISFFIETVSGLF